MPTSRVKLVVFVPKSHSDVVREALGTVGAGRIGKYVFCSFSSDGYGRFRPETGAQPSIGRVGNLETVPEERIEVVCERALVANAIGAIKKVHPYEEVAYDVYPLEDY